MKSTSGIYQIVNNVTQKRYIGRASNMRTRINGHLYDLKRGIHCNSYLQRAWNKYGPANFSFSVIEETIVSQLPLREDYWINVLGTLDKEKGYNIAPPDPNGKVTHSEETRKKLSQINKCRKVSPESLKILSNYWGPMSEQHKELLRKSREHIDFTKLHREKRGKKVINIQTGELHSSLAEVCDIIGMSKGALSRILLGKRKNNTNYKYLD